MTKYGIIDGLPRLKEGMFYLTTHSTHFICVCVCVCVCVCG